jgi:hypothetical protein
MASFLCLTCGTQYPPSDVPPARCPICEDERQYIGLNGQEWIPFEAAQKRFHNVFFEETPGQWGIITEPKFGIGQRALLLKTGAGNILWDCLSLVDRATVEMVRALGGISAIAISHPHYYSSMAEWSRAFGHVPIYLHEDDREWVQYPSDAIRYWNGETHSIGDGLTLIRVGGHFTGYQVLHSAHAEDGKGALYTGDMPQVCPDRRYVSFMYSYPNLIPVNATTVRRIVKTLEPWPYAKLYGAWRGFVVQGDPKVAVRVSAERYLRALGNEGPLY